MLNLTRSDDSLHLISLVSLNIAALNFFYFNISQKSFLASVIWKYNDEDMFSIVGFEGHISGKGICFFNSPPAERNPPLSMVHCCSSTVHHTWLKAGFRIVELVSINLAKNLTA